MPLEDIYSPVMLSPANDRCYIFCCDTHSIIQSLFMAQFMSGSAKCPLSSPGQNHFNFVVTEHGIFKMMVNNSTT